VLPVVHVYNVAGRSAKGVRFVKGSGSGDGESAGLRLQVAAAVAAGSFAALTVAQLIAGAADRPGLSRLDPGALPLGFGATAVTLVLALVARRIRPEAVPGVAYGLGIGTALVVAIIEAWRPLPSTAVGASLVSLWIVLFPLYLPAEPRRTLACALVAASMGPVVLLGAAALGLRATPLAPAVFFFVPNYAAAVVAWQVARALDRAERQARLLGSYRLISRIGGGGMGEVWRAEHRFLARPAAAKIIRRDIVDGPRGEVALKRFEIEARITAQLTSPHTVRLFDYGVAADGSVYYLMELLDGVDLQEMVERHGPLEPARAVHFLIQACHALAEAHAAGLIHRDIKPSNLVACRAGLERDFLKVLDFGLVKPLAEAPLDLTQSGTLMGSPGYVAPEMALGKAVDCRTDIYSLGCVAYFLLTGREVFEVRSPALALRDHVYRQPEPPSRIVGGIIPRELDELVIACLAKNPDDRPDGAEALARKLAAAIREPSSQARGRS